MRETIMSWIQNIKNLFTKNTASTTPAKKSTSETLPEMPSEINENDFDVAFKEVLKFEGGYSDHWADSGGKTMYGITESVARRHGYTGNMKNLSLSFAKEIYKKDYWLIQKLDQVAAIDLHIAIEMFDSGVNMGPYQPQKFLQVALSCFKGVSLTVDGKVGAQTIKSLEYVCRRELSRTTVLKMLEAQQGTRYMELIKNNSSQKAYTDGWFKRVWSK